MSYDKEIKERVVKYRISVHTIKETCEVFGVGNYAVSKWVKQYEETGDLSNKPLNREFKKTFEKDLFPPRRSGGTGRGHSTGNEPGNGQFIGGPGLDGTVPQAPEH